jgi:hypothetical protein
VGFWGTYIIGCSDQPLEALDALKGDAQDVCWRRAGHDDWQIIQIHRGPAGWSALPLPAPWEGTLVAIMEQTQRPVLAITELDEDGSQLIGYSRQAGRWGGWLNLEAILPHLDRRALPSVYEDENGDYQVDDSEDFRVLRQQIMDDLYRRVGPPAPQAADLAARWAREAGLAPDPATLLSALESGQFTALLRGLGLASLT